MRCPDGRKGRSKDVDLRFTIEGANLWLVAENGAGIFMPHSAHDDCGAATYQERRIRVNGLGPGVDLCVRTKRCAVSHAFFTDDVAAGDEEVALWHVTRVQ